MQNKIISKAPGRVCLFGDHQDYLGLPIIATTIDKEITIKAIKNNTEKFKIFKKDLNIHDSIDINQNISSDEKDFLKIALKVLKKYNCIPNEGYDIEIKSEIPINSGLSSSSALIVAWVNFLLTTFSDIPISPRLLADLSYEIEVKEMNGSGGKMDQYTIANGKTIFLDTKSNEIESFDHKLCDMIIGVSNKPKDTQGLLKKLKENALNSIEIVKDKVTNFSLYDEGNIKNISYLDYLDDYLKPYFTAAVGNYKITMDAKKEFSSSNLNINKISDLMNSHHNYLKKDLKITTPEIDNMIDISFENGAIGSKIVGSGGGGSIVSLSTNSNTSNKIVSKLKGIGVKDAFIARKGSGPSIYYE